MSLLVVVPDRNNAKLIAKLQSLLPDVNIEQWREGVDCTGFEFVLAWNPPESIWQQLPNLKAISSYGAGVDALLQQPTLPAVPVARIVDPQLAVNMSEYVLHAIGFFKLRFNQYLVNKRSQFWKPRRANAGNKVGILGLGELGQAVSAKLVANGFEVSGWSRSFKSLANVQCYSGADGLNEMLAPLDYLVCLLPLTDDTRGILNQSLFSQLPQGAVVINVARGDHLNEADLLAALDQGQLGGAALDVFSAEPLPQQHPFWRYPDILLTPHVSAVTNVDTACAQITDNYLRLQAGKQLLNLIDPKLGY
jgi:glyoxylate/hydroxypyruvate reductase